MANNIIEIHINANKNEMSPGQVITAGEGSNFDTITERWYFGAGGIPAGYQQRGNLKPAGYNVPSLFCLGPSDVERLPGANNPVIATITWRGLINPNNTDLSTGTETYSTRETNYDSMTNIPGVPSPGTGRKCRLIDVVPGYSLRSIHTTKQTRPKPQGGRYPTPSGAPQINASDQITVWGGC